MGSIELQGRMTEPKKAQHFCTSSTINYSQHDMLETQIARKHNIATLVTVPRIALGCTKVLAVQIFAL